MLVAGPDFGTGSSREHAVWALQNYGFKAVISSRFADIFRGNSGKAGLVAAQVDEKVVQRLWDYLEEYPGRRVTVDLESRTVQAGEGPDAIEDSFDIDDYTRWRLLEGLDDIGITLGSRRRHRGVRGTRPSWKLATPRATRSAENPYKQGPLVIVPHAYHVPSVPREGRAQARRRWFIGREASEQDTAHRRARRALRGEPQAGCARARVGARHHHA